jgi:hypothetical protein
MNVTIFSRDRACQLELFLRSMKKYFKQWDKYQINVLYTYSNEEFKKGYDITFEKHPEIRYIKETSFKEDTLRLVDKTKEYTIFFVDDNVFKEPLDIDDRKIRVFKTNEGICCVSLRLHPNLTYCYPARVAMFKPAMTEDNVFDWRGKPGDYGYPMSLDGHLFRTNDIFIILEKLNYNNPNSLESNLAANPINRPFMIMFDKSVILNIPVNKVQNFNNNIHGNISAEYLNKEYLSGKILSIKNIDGFKNISCHQEIPLLFE